MRVDRVAARRKSYRAPPARVSIDVRVVKRLNRSDVSPVASDGDARSRAPMRAMPDDLRRNLWTSRARAPSTATRHARTRRCPSTRRKACPEVIEPKVEPAGCLDRSLASARHWASRRIRRSVRSDRSENAHRGSVGSLTPGCAAIVMSARRSHGASTRSRVVHPVKMIAGEDQVVVGVVARRNGARPGARRPPFPDTSAGCQASARPRESRRTPG